MRYDYNLNINWDVQPSPGRIQAAMHTSAVRIDYRFERRDIANAFIEDVTPAFLKSGCYIEGNNDRDIFRTAQFHVDPERADINPVGDHIAVFADLLVDNSYLYSRQMGLFVLNWPQKEIYPVTDLHSHGVIPVHEKWTIGANDLSIHLLDATTTELYSVAAGTNYITAVKSILDTHGGFRYVIPATTLTLPAVRDWPIGTPWLRVVNDLLDSINMYSLRFDNTGVAWTRTRDVLLTKTPDVYYTGNDFILAGMREDLEDTRFANQVVAYSEDPLVGILRSVATNEDPDSPTSTVNLGRTITKPMNKTGVVSQTVLDEIALQELQEAGSVYKRATITTQPDIRREAHEVYDLSITHLMTNDRWWVRSWRLPLDTGSPMSHNISRIEKVVI